MSLIRSSATVADESNRVTRRRKTRSARAVDGFWGVVWARRDLHRSVGSGGTDRHDALGDRDRGSLMRHYFWLLPLPLSPPALPGGVPPRTAAAPRWYRA